MGMFDTVYFQCLCGKKIEEQFKCGPCILGHWDLYALPKNMKAMLDGYTFVCECGEKYKIETQVRMFVNGRKVI